MQNSFTKEIDEALQLEAEGMLSDLSTSPLLLANFLSFDKRDRERAVNYIRSVLDECYKEGHLKVAIFHESQHLYGYAIFFTTANAQYPTYLHKIFVKEPYRNQGLGGKLLQSIVKGNSRVALLCPIDKVAFYESHGFNYSQPFEAPDNEKFRLSRGLYSDLCLMKNYQEQSEIPLFFLNDSDLTDILGL